MDVAFRKARIGDLDEASSLLQILNGAGAGVAHRGLPAADKLMDYVLRRALIGHLTLDAFGLQLLLLLYVLLEIAICRPNFASSHLLTPFTNSLFFFRLLLLYIFFFFFFFFF